MRLYDEKLMDRTCRIIDAGGYIVLKRGEWYMQQHTNIAADFDSAVWGTRRAALHFDTLEMAYLLAPYFECRVVVYYPRGKKR